ncbi:MAG: butyrate kinase [Myxococcota bacterium]|jgi:butyrate kinase|nr:butyrate kinase [Myxococcota bacterium]
MSELILVINPGSTSTKVGLFQDGAARNEENLTHEAEELRPDRPVFEQLPLRLAAVRELLVRWGVAVGELAAVVGRGGLLPPLPGGTYQVDTDMLDRLARAERGEHASNLGAALAFTLAQEAGRPAYIVDPVSVDELWPVARVTGRPELARSSVCHALNLRATAHAHATKLGRPLAELRLVVAHLGGGVSLAAVAGGRLVDVINPREEGPMSADRAGGLPTLPFGIWAVEKGYTVADLERLCFREGGFFAHLGTRDLREIYRRVEAGDEAAQRVVEALVYQVARAIGGLAACLAGRVDAVLLTGGMAKEPRLTAEIRDRVAFIGPVHVYPGENELAALAAGAARVLRGEELARTIGQPGK